MRPLMLTQIRAIGTGKVAESALVSLSLLVKCTNVCLQLRVRRRRESALCARVWTIARVRTLVVFFGLVCREGFTAAGEAARVGAVARVAEEMTG